MDLKKDLIGQYTGSCTPGSGGRILVIRSRVRIYENEKGHLSYVITEQVTDRQRRQTQKETYVGLVTGHAPSTREGVLHLHLSPLDRPYRSGKETKCEFSFSDDFDSYFIVFTWREGGEEIRFRLRKESSDGSGRRRRRSST